MVGLSKASWNRDYSAERYSNHDFFLIINLFDIALGLALCPATLCFGGPCEMTFRTCAPLRFLGLDPKIEPDIKAACFFC